jgi:hypothetical protein
MNVKPTKVILFDYLSYGSFDSNIFEKGVAGKYGCVDLDVTDDWVVITLNNDEVAWIHFSKVAAILGRKLPTEVEKPVPAIVNKAKVA